MQQYMVKHAEEMLMVAEERIQANLRESEVILMSAAVSMVQKQIDSKANLDTGEVQRYLTSLNEVFIFTDNHIPGYQDIFWYKDGTYLSGHQWSPPADLAVEKLPWYSTANPGSIIISPPYQSPRSLNQTITIATMLTGDDKEDYGFLGIDVNLGEIAESVVAFQAEGGGYGYLIGPVSAADSRLRFMAYPDPRYKDIPLELMGPQYKNLQDRLYKGTEAISSVTLNTVQDENVVAFYRKTSTGWYAGLAFPKKKYFSSVYTMSAIFSLICIFMMIILCYFLLRLSRDKIQSDEENRAKSSFLAQVSHEIRTPLNSILGMAEIILRKDVKADVYEDVSIIKQSGNILLSIINNILDFAKMETNRILIESNPYNLASMINDVLNIARMRLLDKPVDFFVNMDSSIPAELIGDEVKIRQILINLLNNAIKYTKLGYIRLNIGRQPAPLSAFGDRQVRIVFTVEDTGIGIKPADMKHLFSEFTRLDTELNHGVEGSGLGLTIANAFCRAMEGDITVESAYGKGSVFTAAIIQSYSNSKPIAQLEDPGKRVLIYEDRPAYLQSLLTALNSLNVQPQCAWDLGSFIQSIQGDAFDYAFVPARHASECISRWEASGSPIKLMVMLNTDDMSSVYKAGSVHLPIYSCILANILNGITETERQSFRKDRVRFTAPDVQILVVDDLPTNLRVAEELMKPYGMKIDTCLSGSDALALIRRNRYDLVFMDHMMPEMDGLMATEIIRRQGAEGSDDNYYRSLPIVMLTANAMSGQREIFLKNGISDFLAKPIDVGKLNRILETWIPKEKRQKPGPAGTPPAETGPSPASTVPLPAIPGVELQTGLQNAGGSLDSYTSILSYFCGDVDERIPLIREAAEKGDLPPYTTMVHAIKGASRSIGALTLGDLAAELETAGRGGDLGVVREKTGTLLEKLEELLRHIRSSLGEQGTDKAGAEDEEPLPADLADLGLGVLRNALDALDTKGVDMFLSGIDTRGRNAAVKGFISRLEQHILLFEYDKAIKMIDSVGGGG
ncbi:MAG: response regulator, partial [Treponema sp.]|nr:response regulator [Treponema sp.]